MTQKELSVKDSHLGRKVKRIRISQGLKQENIAPLMGVTQQAVSKYEKQRVLNDKILEKFAIAFGITVDDIHEWEDDSTTVIIENNNTFGDNDTINAGYVAEDFDKENTYHYYPIDKIQELYERLLKEEKEKNSELEKRIAVLEAKLKG